MNGRELYLGAHGSAESRAAYDRVVAEWSAAGRVAAPATPSAVPAVAISRPAESAAVAGCGYTVDELLLAFLEHARTSYRRPDGTPTSEYDNFRDAARPLQRLYGSTPAASFGPLALNAVRQEMVKLGWARTYVNKHVGRIKRIFRHATENEMVPPSTYQGLQAVGGLRAGRSDAREIRAAFDAAPVPSLALHDRFNVAPATDVSLVRLYCDGHRVLTTAHWGLVPGRTRGTPKVRPMNARHDNVLSSPMFKGPMARHRCLVPAVGFYEWKGAKPPKVPFYFRLKDGEPFAFAGLWDRWRPEPGVEPVDTCLHITAEPNAIVAPVHDRMPAILHRADYGRWLDPQVPATEAAKLLRPYPAGEMTGYTVSTAVNKVGHDGPELVEPEPS